MSISLFKTLASLSFILYLLFAVESKHGSDLTVTFLVGKAIGAALLYNQRSVLLFSR